MPYDWQALDEDYKEADVSLNFSLPKGTYSATIEDVIWDDAKATLKQVFRIDEGEYIGRSVTDFLSFFNRNGERNKIAAGNFKRAVIALDDADKTDLLDLGSISASIPYYIKTAKSRPVKIYSTGEQTGDDGRTYRAKYLINEFIVGQAQNQVAPSQEVASAPF